MKIHCYANKKWLHDLDSRYPVKPGKIRQIYYSIILFLGVLK